MGLHPPIAASHTQPAPMPLLTAKSPYAKHAQELALHKAHNAAEPGDQRLAIADWVYWQHLEVLLTDAVSTDAAV